MRDSVSTTATAPGRADEGPARRRAGDPPAPPPAPAPILAWSDEDQARFEDAEAALAAVIAAFAADATAQMAAHPPSRRLLEDAAGLERHRQQMGEYLRTLISGRPDSDATLRRSRDVGRAHIRAGVPPSWYAVLYNRWFAAYHKAEAEGLDLPPLDVLRRRWQWDLGTTLDAYHDEIQQRWHSERRQLEQAVSASRREAGTDALTGLANRRRLLAHLRGRSRRPGLAALFVDLDGFKAVNDSLGHDAGDEVLSTVARRLRGALRPQDLLARHGGDEFVAVLERLATAAETEAVAGRILDTVGRPILAGGHTVSLTASVGIALAAAGGTDPEGLVRQADLAMYAAKRGGGGQWRLYGPDLGTAEVTQQRVARALAAALRHPRRQGLQLAYQPIVALRDRHPVGVKAVPRWEHRSFGSIPPLQLAAAAAEAGLLPALGQWTLDQALADLRRWRDLDGRLGALAMVVELSPLELVDPALPGHVLQVLARHGLAPEALVLRLTRAALLPHWRAALRRTLAALAASGVLVTLDDSPRAQSVVATVLDLPIRRIAVSPEVVRRLPGDRSSRALVRALAAAASELGMDVVATGVETEAQAAALDALGCRLAQGSLYGPEVLAAELLARLAALPPGPAGPTPQP